MFLGGQRDFGALLLGALSLLNLQLLELQQHASEIRAECCFGGADLIGRLGQESAS